MTALAQALNLEHRFSEALTAAMHCLDSPVLMRWLKIAAIVSAAQSLVGLGRFDDAFQLVEKDFRPIFEAQRTLLTATSPRRRQHHKTSEQEQRCFLAPRGDTRNRRPPGLPGRRRFDGGRYGI
jgi:hypothetical protein